MTSSRQAEIMRRQAPQHLLAAQAAHRDVAPFVALYQLERAEEERAGAKHVGSEVRERRHHGEQGTYEQE